MFDKAKIDVSSLSDFDKMAETLKREGVAYSLTKGASMRPLFREHKDIAVIRALNRAPKAGDVLLYRKKGHSALVLHRLIRVKKDGSYVIRGDNNYFTEYDVLPEDIVGQLKEFYRNGKHFDCQKNRKYRLYSLYIRHSYFIRFGWKRRLRPFLSRIKRTIMRDLDAKR